MTESSSKLVEFSRIEIFGRAPAEEGDDGGVSRSYLALEGFFTRSSTCLLPSLNILDGIRIISGIGRASMTGDCAGIIHEYR
ncbi:hypothetical protein [Consotaella salsifontis]|uniref:hypothetical protein n=1 Tax=Consotaella salsifontis TaxID=1365950 RepID=UPI000999460D|nr:hypothetical protein [Consotaella salsifontis]